MNSLLHNNYILDIFTGTVMLNDTSLALHPLHCDNILKTDYYALRLVYTMTQSLRFFALRQCIVW